MALRDYKCEVSTTVGKGAGIEHDGGEGTEGALYAVVDRQVTANKACAAHCTALGVRRGPEIPRP